MSSITSNNISKNKSKFTRGEKCIYAHLIVTFVLLLCICVIYFIHLSISKHNERTALSVSRRVMPVPGTSSNYLFAIGVVYLSVNPARLLCNTLLLKNRWSAAPGQCVAMRTDPALAHLLPNWKIKYMIINGISVESYIKSSVIHPHFTRDELMNNVGVFEHDAFPLAQKYEFMNHFISDDFIKSHDEYLSIVGWKDVNINHTDKPLSNLNIFEVEHLDTRKCKNYVSSILDLRSNEFCMIVRGKPGTYFIDLGTMLVVNNKIIGYYSWGDKQGRGVPLITITILSYKEWLNNIVDV